MRIRILTAVALVAAVTGAAALSTAGSTAAAPPRPSGDERAERATAHRTQRFMRAFERRDLRAVSRMLSARVELVHPITFSGEQDPEARFDGKQQVLGYLRTVFSTMGRIDFRDERLTVGDGGRASIVQADGDFTTADGRPYRNVYVFRFDWRNGRIAGAEEYFNPVTFSETFGRPLG